MNKKEILKYLKNSNHTDDLGKHLITELENDIKADRYFIVFFGGLISGGCIYAWLFFQALANLKALI